MEIQFLNKYLSKLEGPGLIENLHIDKNSNIDELKIKFQGDTGTIDNGEIELSFSGVEIINLPQGFMTPVKIKVASESEVKHMFNANYQDDDCNLYYIEDSENVIWHIYALSYEVNVLPIHYGK